MTNDDLIHQPHTEHDHFDAIGSSTAAVIDKLTLLGARPPAEDPEYRPLPEEVSIEALTGAMIEAAMAMLTDTALEDDLDEVLWSIVNIFHRRVSHLDRLLGDNESSQREAQQAQDGSEVRSVELERLFQQGQDLTERRDAFESIRDAAGDHYRAQTGSAWLPRTGSKVSHKTLTASVIESRDFISAKRRRETEIHCPEGTRIAFAGGAEMQDHKAIWNVLDQTLVKYPDMILLHGANPAGAELIAARWADTRGVTQVTFKPNWAAHGKAAPFRRNDQLLSSMPKGLIACSGGGGITENLIDKSRKLGIPVLKIGT